MDPFVTYKENVVFRIQSLGLKNDRKNFVKIFKNFVRFKYDMKTSLEFCKNFVRIL
jgi:hypothetical protein